MRATSVSLYILTFGLALAASSLQAHAGETKTKVEICHVPPGNPANFHTITVSESAADKHVEHHGDFLGACDEFCAYFCNDGNACTLDDNGLCEVEGCPAPAPVDCNDSDACTTDACNPATGCVNTAVVCGANASCGAATGVCACDDGYVSDPDGSCVSAGPPVDECGLVIPEASSCSETFVGDTGTFVDARDGHVYGWVRIGSQIWMSTNLDHGLQVPVSVDQTDNCLTEKHCYGDDPASCDVFGGLYTQNELMGYRTGTLQGICPAGWYVPTDSDWTQLLAFIGGGTVNLNTAGGVLKSIEVPTTWYDNNSGGHVDNVGATDLFGFNAYSGGFSQPEPASFGSLGYSGNFWSSDRTLYHIIAPQGYLTVLPNWALDWGFSLRCVSLCSE